MRGLAAVRVQVTPAGAATVPAGDLLVPSRFDLDLDREDGSPCLGLTFEVRDEVPQCRRAELRSTEDGREVLSSDLRGVKIEDLLEFAVRSVAMLPTGRSEPGPEGAYAIGYMGVGRDPEDQARAVQETRKVRREARRRVTPEMLTEVARVYRENLDGNPTAAVAEFTGRAHRTAALYVHQARQAGLLGAASPGKKGEQ
jgi:hypothetical protein